MILVDGNPGDRLSAMDRGLHFGDGLFETLAVDGGRILSLDRHLARLAEGCERLGIRMPPPGALAAECERARDGGERAVIKIIVTRGVSGRGYATDPEAPPTRVVAAYPWPEGVATGAASLRVCATRLGRNPRLAGIKHLNRLEQVLARAEPNPLGCDEGLMLDEEDNVIEGIASNVFVIRDGRLLTPDLSACGVAGIVRSVVLEEAEAVSGHSPEVVPLGLEAVRDADECFLTGSLIGIRPVHALEGQPVARGPLAERLRARLEALEAIARV